MERLLQGVSKFQREVFPQHKDLFEKLGNGQSPEVLFITCADSRIVPDMITQSGPGELFICRNAGNMVPPYGELHGGVSATIEYAILALNVKHIIVCGHTDCGAMKALRNPSMASDMPTVKSWLNHGEMARRIVAENYPDLAEPAHIHALTEENVVAQLNHLRTHPSVAARLASGSVSIHGWMFYIRTGQVEAYDPQRHRFVPIDQYQVEAPSPRPRLQVAG
jgi:carbonic anhydrase